MTDNDPVSSTARAVAEIAKAVPVYQDLAQPAVRKLSSDLETVADAIHMVMAPLRALVWGYDRIEDFLKTRVAEKLKGIPPERLIAPPLHVAGPALEALRYAGHDEALRELYANLLATSLDAETVREAHPAFVEILKSLSPDEARLLRLFAAQSAWPLVDLVADNGNGTFNVVIRNFSLLGLEAGCVAPDLAANYVDNLVRLGIIEIPWSSHLVSPGTYEPIEAHELIAPVVAHIQSGGTQTPRFVRKLAQTTTLGHQFIRACVLERSHAAPGLPGGAG